MLTSNRFQILTHQQKTGYWNAALARVMEECRRLASYLQAEIRAKRLAVCTCLVGRTNALSPGGINTDDLEELVKDYQLELSSPFEGVASISGGVWRASEYFESDADDALLKLRFEPGTRDLPIHSHDYSDRVIFVADGKAEFVICDAEETKVIEVSRGDVLIFARGLRHTFRTGEESLLLLSYHSPFIELEDSRQYTLTDERSLA
ncbi:MAG: cupin domain-containing protein [Aureliella sp.]